MVTNLNFTWREHGHRTLSQVTAHLGRPEYSDVKFYCQSKLFSAHKLVLIAASPYFEKLFSEIPPRELPVVVVRNTDPIILELVLTYVYSGVANVPSDKAEAFLNLALDFELRGLEKRAQDALRSKIQKLVQNGQQNGEETSVQSAEEASPRVETPARASRSAAPRSEVVDKPSDRKRRREEAPPPASPAPKTRESAPKTRRETREEPQPVTAPETRRKAAGPSRETVAEPVAAKSKRVEAVSGKSKRDESSKRSEQSDAASPLAAPIGLGWEDRVEGGLFAGSDLEEAPRAESRPEPAPTRFSSRSYPSTVRASQNGPKKTPSTSLRNVRRTPREEPSGFCIVGTDATAILGGESHPSPPGPSPKLTLRRGGGSWAVDQEDIDEESPTNVRKMKVVLTRVNVPKGVTTVKSDSFWQENDVNIEDTGSEFEQPSDDNDIRPQRIPKIIDRTRKITHMQETIFKGASSSGQVFYFCGYCDFKNLSMSEEAYAHMCP